MLSIRDVFVSVIFVLVFVVPGCHFEKRQKTDISASSVFDISVVGEKLVVSCSSVDLAAYQRQPMANPKGGDKFKGSNFIHPLKTPSGFVVTGFQPDDHLHHFGLWWPWKSVAVDGRTVLFWELQAGEGIVEAKGVRDYKTDKGMAYFAAESDYVDRTAPNGPEVVLHEQTAVTVSGIVQLPALGYYLDIGITHRCATSRPVEIVSYRYSGFTIRGTEKWDRDNSTLLTSAGMGWSGSNFSRADWVRVEGDTDNGGKAGFVMMACPENRDRPQRLRTWGQEIDKAIFINFNPVQEKPWLFEPGKDYTQRYRLFVYDGTITAEQAQRLWEDYAAISNKR